MARELFAKMAGSLDSNRKIRKGGANAREVYLWVLRQIALRDSDGSIPADDVRDYEHVADQLMRTPADAQAGLDAALRVRLLEIDDDQCCVVGWGDDWGRRPASGKERQAKYIAKLKAGAGLAVGDAPTVTDTASRVTVSNVSNGSEERRVEEKRESAPSPALFPDSEPPGKKQRRKREQKPETPCPDDLAPNERQRSRAAVLGVDADQQFRLFKAHHGSRGNLFRDWSMAFDKWLENAPTYSRAGPALGTSNHRPTPPRLQPFPDDPP